MSSKDSSVFEVRKHNDFSALLSSDDEDQKSSSILESTSTHAPVAVSASAGNAEDVTTSETAEESGFETFSTTRKPKRQSLTKMPQRPSTGSHVAPSVAVGGAKPLTGGFPKELIIPKVDNSIELYDFPSTLKTGDLRKFLQAYEGHFRLKWNNDTSCYVVFDDLSLGIILCFFYYYFLTYRFYFVCVCVVERALSELKSEEIKIKPFVEVVAVVPESSAEATH